MLYLRNATKENSVSYKYKEASKCQTRADQVHQSRNFHIRLSQAKARVIFIVKNFPAIHHINIIVLSYDALLSPCHHHCDVHVHVKLTRHRGFSGCKLLWFMARSLSPWLWTHCPRPQCTLQQIQIHKHKYRSLRKDSGSGHTALGINGSSTKKSKS